MSCSCPLPRSDRDRRAAAALYQVFADDKASVKAAWTTLFVLGHVDSVSVMQEYELR